MVHILPFTLRVTMLWAPVLNYMSVLIETPYEALKHVRCDGFVLFDRFAHSFQETLNVKYSVYHPFKQMAFFQFLS